MVTDVSSVALEYLVLDRPIIYFDSPIFFTKTIATIYKNYGFENYSGNPRTDPMINAGRHTGLVIERADELPAAINRCLSNPKEFSVKRQGLIQQLLYNPGAAGLVAAETISQLLELPAQRTVIEMENKAELINNRTKFDNGKE